MPQDYELNRHLRYDLIGGKSNSAKQESMAKQQERIKEDELLAKTNKILREEKETNMRAEWEANLEVKCISKAASEMKKRSDGELLQANKTLKIIRREALRQLLEKDREKYNQELLALGKTIYVQRM